MPALPHLSHLAPWCIALTALMLFWRAQLALSNAPLPSRWAVAGVLVVAAVLTLWTEGSLFGKQAENAGQYLQKGRSVYVEGRLKTDKYKDKDGVQKTSVEVVGNVVQFLGGKGEGGGEQKAPPKGKPAPAPDDDDLPF